MRAPAMTSYTRSLPQVLILKARLLVVCWVSVWQWLWESGHGEVSRRGRAIVEREPNPGAPLPPRIFRALASLPSRVNRRPHRPPLAVGGAPTLLRVGTL